jgi:hypothetical protein
MSNPLIMQIAIGAGGLLVGFVIGTLMAGKRLRGTRAAARKQAEDLQSQDAMRRLRIRELEAKLAEARTAVPQIEELPGSYQQFLSAQPAQSRSPARPRDVSGEVSPPLN